MALDTVGALAPGLDTSLTEHTTSRLTLGAWLAKARWPPAAAAAAGLASCVVLLAQLGPVLRALYQNADNAVTLLLPSSHPAGSLTTLGDHPWFEAWWFMHATAGMADHLLLWKAAPFVVAFLGMAVVVGTAWSVAGRVGGLIVGVGLVAMSPSLRAVLLVPEARVGLPLHAAVLCGVVLAIGSLAPAGRMSAGRWIGAGVGVVAFTAPGATDQLLLPAALGPYIATALLYWWQDRSQSSRTLVYFALLTSLLSVEGAKLVTQLTERSGVSVGHFQVHFTTIGDLGSHLATTLHLFAILGGGGLGGRTLAGPLVLVGLFAACAALGRGALRLRRGPMMAAERARMLYLTFWTCALLFTIAAVAATSASGHSAVYDAAQRYLLGGWVAFVALLGAAATTPARSNLLLIAVTGFALLNLQLNLSSVRQPWEYGSSRATEISLQRFVLAHGASVGYGAYWDVIPLRLDTGSRLRTVPILQLGQTGTWTGQAAAANSSWFLHQPGTHNSFLVADSRAQVPSAPRTPPARFGRPAWERRFGALVVYIYRHDLARDLQGRID